MGGVLSEIGLQENGEIRDRVAAFILNPLFQGVDHWLIENGQYRRPVRPQDASQLDFSTILSRDNNCSSNALMGHRMLLNIYETDLVFLPNETGNIHDADFLSFYSSENSRNGEALRPDLERHLFGFLEQEIDVSGLWTQAAMDALFEERFESNRTKPNPLTDTILGANSPEEAAHFFLIQLAGDFLTEASAMARNMPGSYGKLQSALFKILIDEYGYGIAEAKHSTIFGETMRSVGLSPDVHTYWQFYLPTSLALTNYFHFICRHRPYFFRYVGALYYTEQSLVDTTKYQSKMLREIFKDEVDTHYFDEHTHIDKYHGRMVRDQIILPIIETYGAQVIPEIVRGFEEFRLLEDLASEELIAQILWSDGREDFKRQAANLASQYANREGLRFSEPKGELSVTHSHDANELIMVESGQLSIVTSHSQNLTLREGEGVVIPRHRLHGSLVESEVCTYVVHELPA